MLRYQFMFFFGRGTEEGIHHWYSSSDRLRPIENSLGGDEESFGGFTAVIFVARLP